MKYVPLSFKILLSMPYLIVTLQSKAFKTRGDGSES